MRLLHMVSAHVVALLTSYVYLSVTRLWLCRPWTWIWKLHLSEWCLQLWSCDVRTSHGPKIIWQVSVLNRTYQNWIHCQKLSRTFGLKIRANFKKQVTSKRRTISSKMGYTSASRHRCIIQNGWSFATWGIFFKVLISICWYNFLVYSGKSLSKRTYILARR